MSGYDLDDANGTLTQQFKSTKNMIDVNVDKNLINRGEGAWIVVTGAFPENQMTTGVEALMELQKQFPSPDLGQLIEQMITYHVTKAVPGTNDDGTPMLHYRLPVAGADMYTPSSTGALGYGDWPFHVGKTMRALGTWYLRGEMEPQFMDTMALLRAFVRGYESGLFWSIPSGFSEGTGDGHFAGHMHEYANGLMGMLWEAEARLLANPADTVAPTVIDFVKNSFLFIRNMHGGAMSVLGNFGEVCTLGDMLRLAVKLTELGAGDFNEDIDRWMRNQGAEAQIRGAITIVSDPDPLKDRVGEKVIGLFFEDAAHPLAIPDAHNDQGDLTLQLVACGLGNMMHGIYDVWEHIVELKNDVAQVNLLLNKATWYLDIKSEIPYRGVVNVSTRATLGPITSLELRIPEGVANADVQVLANDAPVAFTWVRTNYVKVTGVQPNTRYTVKFPLPTKQLVFKQLRNQTQNWYESDDPVPSGTTQDYAFHDDLAQNTYLGTFRGNTLVAVDHRPAGGIALYQGQDRADCAALGAADAPSTPTHPSARFRLKPH
jgi:hypothetical protein